MYDKYIYDYCNKIKDILFSMENLDFISLWKCLKHN